MSTVIKNKKVKITEATKKIKTGFKMHIRSRHPSHQKIRKLLPKLDFPTVIRLGSLTELPDVFPIGRRVELNKVEGIQNSSNKYLMKQCFNKSGVKTAKWFYFGNAPSVINGEDNSAFKEGIAGLPFPVVLKGKFGSRNTSNYLCKTFEEFQTTIANKTLSNYIIEKYYSYSREYRLHVSEEGCFYTCRKMMKTDTPEDQKWHRHEDNCVWITKENEAFDTPNSWDAIIKDCITALQAVGLDFGAFDVRVQSNKNKDGKKVTSPEWILIEVNSAPSFGTITEQKYLETLPQLAVSKAKKLGIVK